MTKELLIMEDVEKQPIRIIFVTNTEGKAREAQAILGNGFEITHKKIDLPENQAVYPKDVIEDKARQAFKKIKTPVLVEDTSLHFEAWDGFPGALVRWILDPNNKGCIEEKKNGCERICNMMKDFKNKNIYALSTVCFFDGKNMQIFEGRVDGKIPDKPQGENGFGWDFIFIPNGSNKTFSEMGMEEKNKISMRKKALEQLKKYFSSNK